MSLVSPNTEWPLADRMMWDMLWRDAGPLDDPGALSHLRQTTRRSLEPRYGRWVKWLYSHDRDAVLLHPAERATLPRLQAWVEALAHTRPMTRLAFVEGVLCILRAAMPDQDWTGQLRLHAGLKSAAGRGDPARKSGRILSSARLLEVGMYHATTTADDAPTQLARMICQRDGLMVALLAVLPLRLRSYSELALNQSIHVTDEAIFISLSEDMTKTGVPWDVVVPPQVEPLLRRYIVETRPAFMNRGHQNHNILWVGKKGEVIGQNYIGTLIGNLTLKITGKRVSPHLFRDAAATTLARISPESAQLICPVLAHSSFRTAERHYNHAQTIDAGRDYASLIKRMKGDR